MFVSASIGIAFDTPGHERDQLLRNADVAMYTAKAAARAATRSSSPRCTPRPSSASSSRPTCAAALDRGELVVHYQPIVDARDRARSSASRRWSAGTTRRAAWSRPDAFIPLAEETGLIVAIGARCCARRASDLRDVAAELAPAPRLSVSVNLSPRQLDDRRLVDEVAAALERSRARPGVPDPRDHRERHDAATPTRRCASLTRLKELGVRLAVDDFGTGYSSLSYLQRFPIDILKIDRSFVDGIDRARGRRAGPRDRPPRPDAAPLSHRRGRRAREQFDRLRALGCEHAQGFYFCRPVPARLPTLGPR